MKRKNVLALMMLVSVMALATGCGQSQTTATSAAAESTEAAGEEATDEQTSASSEMPTLSVTLDASESVVATHLREATATGATATFKLELPDGVSAEDLDYSAAQIAMTDGDGYYVDEFVDPVVALDASGWEDGEYVFEFDDEQIAALFTRAKIRGSQSDVYSEGGPDWTAFGGNGNGQYYFNLTVSGITYNGEALEDATFRVCYYAYGRDASDKARITLSDYINVYDYEESGAQERTLADQGTEVDAADTPTWTWVGDTSEEKPVLCDTEQDDFYVTWPEGTDASALTAEDVEIVLYSQYGDEVALEANKDYFVYTSEGETQIALPYVNMAFTPVFTTMSISVDEDAISTVSAEDLTQEYDIASVYIYQVQHGGLDPNGAVLTYQFYGFDEESLTDWSQLMHGFGYALYVEDENGNRQYYSEENGGSYVDSAEEATIYDATGENDLNIQLWNEAVLYDTTVAVENEDGTMTYRTEVKTVDGEEVTFIKEITEGWDGDDLRGVQMTPSEAKANGLKAAPGYAFPQTDDFYEEFEAYNFGHDYWVAHSMWPWVEGIEQGWLTDPSAKQAGWNGLEKGYDYQYDGDGEYPEWTVEEAQDNEDWWPWLRSEFPDEMWDAVDRSNADKYNVE